MLLSISIKAHVAPSTMVVFNFLGRNLLSTTDSRSVDPNSLGTSVVVAFIP